MNTSFKKLLVALYFFIGLFFSIQSKADHIIGSDISYKCVGTNQYEFTLTFYGNCGSIHFQNLVKENSIQLTCQSLSCNISTSFNVNRIGNAVELSPICPSQPTTCDPLHFNDGQLGIKKFTWKGTVTLQPCTDWIIYRQEPFRDDNATTYNAVNQNIFMQATLNNVAAPLNSSPTFNSLAFAYLCVNKLNNISSGISEIDGDGLSYSLITPRTGQFAANVIAYYAGYSATTPVTSGGLNINQANGDMNIIPTQSGEVSTTSILVEERRNGIVIGSVMRDIELRTIDCNNNIPTISGVNNTASDSIAVCAGENVCFNIYGRDADANQNLTMTWNQVIDTLKASFVITGNSKTPKAKFCWQTNALDVGLHQFSVKITDDFCPIVGENTKTFKIRVYPNPKVQLGNDMVIPCNTTVSILPTITQATLPYYYKWNTGEFTSSVTKGQGIYAVKITDAHGCVGFDSISISSGILANFTFLKKCVGQIVPFTDSSYSLGTGTMTSWSWDFNDPASGASDSSQLQNPTHAFTKSGVFNVRLTVTDNNGCKGTIIKKVKFCDIPKPNFFKQDSCQQKSLPYIDYTTVTTCGIAKYTFDTDDGRSVFQDSLVIPDFSAPFLSPFYPGSPFRFTFPSGSADFPPDSGIFNVKLVAINENGCKDSITKQIIIYKKPIVNILEPDYTFDCSNPVKVLHSTNCCGHPPRTIAWNTGQTSDSITINKPGQYSVTVTDSYGCIDSKTINVQWPLTPAFSTTPFCKPSDPINFIDNSQSVWGLVFWKYTFGDGGTANTQNASHIYAGNQAYRAKLKITDTKGCVDSISHNILHVLPDSIFLVKPNPLCQGQPLNLQSPSGLYIDSLIWSFDNSDSIKLGRNYIKGQRNMQYSNMPDTVFTYAGTYIYPPGSAGNKYDVKLKVKYNNNTCTKYYSDSISIFPPFDVQIDTLFGQCAFDSTHFFGSKVTGNSVTNWNWKFYLDDPVLGPIIKDSSTLRNPVIYLDTIQGSDYDNYHAVLTATNTDGCVVSAPTTNFAKLNLPPLVICASRFCATQTTQFFYFCNTFPEVVIDSVHWDFGDGFTTSAFEPFHIYTDSGTFNVTAQVFNFEFGCTQSSTIPVKMYRLPKAKIQASDTCFGYPTSFKDLSTSFIFDSISIWQWDFGDGTTSTQRNPTHQYTGVGSYNAKLIVTNSVSHCTDSSLVNTINVRDYPSAGFTVDVNHLVTGKPILFTDLSSGGVKWLWRYGDGDSAIIVDPLNKNPQHTYSGTVKSTKVTEIVYNQYGCSDTASLDLDLVIYFVLPNAFSPNGDLTNDMFFPQYKGIEHILEFKIYDRWGQKVYEGDGDMRASWDGKYKGEDQPLGVYVYYAKAVAFNGEEFIQSGKVTLLR
jgi:gliding motility-associated-like protein